MRPRISVLVSLSAAAAVCIGISGELVARYALGLGDPPLLLADPDLEYRLKPGDYTRFGNRVLINEVSMRDDPIPPPGVAMDERRVLVLGDSVIFGGSLTDQSQLATELAEPTLAVRLGYPVRLLNISAGSWGPGNQLAYLRKYGDFAADAIVLVSSDQDIYDRLTADGTLRRDQRRPISALAEGLTRYLPRYLLSGTSRTAVEPRTPDQRDVEETERYIRDIVEFARQHRMSVAVVHHAEAPELLGGVGPGSLALMRIWRELDLPVFSSGPLFAAAHRLGKPVFRDWVHPTSAGQALLARPLADAAEAALRRAEAAERTADDGGQNGSVSNASPSNQASSSSNE